MQLVTVVTADHLRLDGLYQPRPRSVNENRMAKDVDKVFGMSDPDKSDATALSTGRSQVVDTRVADSKGRATAAILVHGIGGNFYSSRLLLKMAEGLQTIGLATLLINTRGHDLMNWTSWNGRAETLGATYEIVDHCRYDLQAWIEHLTTQGHQRILLLGHSLGGIKSLYFMAHQPDSRVSSMIALSPTRLSHRQMSQSSRGDYFRQTYQHCLSMVEQGEGDQPLAVDFPVRTWISAAAYVEKYGPDEKYNWTTFVDRIEVPTLLLFGQKELERDAAFAGLTDELTHLRASWNCLSIDLIDQADHFYSGLLPELEDAVIRWLTS